MSEQTPERTMSAQEERTLAAVLDQIIPARSDSGLPAAGVLVLDRALRILAQRPDLGLRLVEELQAIDGLARGRGASGFADLDAAGKPDVLRVASEQHPAVFGELLMFAARAYYQHPQVLEAIGLEPRPPYPDGYKVEPTDFSLLDGVRRRSKIYRDVPG